ncbi:transcriptional regulator, LysR family [Noviherbaspirillum humi]|uniref:Transcriptional regulator, LysR family n=1 Tax=Noviherbaspirillum humi TaxID=1688639 RepID=A0A239LNI0_9BURK|nr:LysR family transcriptional regulator [Noviherbaspirillum humi]SNT31229.1 transcriptional regulator, LysR family [Noviherbaspirillum humi]
MDLEPNDLLLFARVADEGSFSRAAQRVGLPKSTVSRRIAALEGHLGERLLLRTTRQLTLTDFGRSMLEHAHQVASEVEAAASLAQHRQARPAGRLRVSMPGDLANVVLAPMLARFLRDYPAIQLQLDLSPRRVDLIGENFDLAIRAGSLPDDATLAARRLAVLSVGLYASPAYLARQGRPAHPADLAGHAVLRLLQPSGQAANWILSRRTERFDLAAMATVQSGAVNSPELLIRLACLDAGIVAVPDHFAYAQVQRGELETVLPGWNLPSETAWAVFPGRRLMPARTRVFLDALQQEFSGPACQAQEEKVRRMLDGVEKRPPGDQPR